MRLVEPHKAWGKDPTVGNMGKRAKKTRKRRPEILPSFNQAWITVISFNGQGQLCLLTCAEWRDLSNHTRMSSIRSRITSEKGEKPCNVDLKISWKSFSTTCLPFLFPNSKILKPFLKSFPTKMKPTKRPAKQKKLRQEKWKKRGGEKAKSKSEDCCVTFKWTYTEKRTPCTWTTSVDLVHGPHCGPGPWTTLNFWRWIFTKGLNEF